MNLLLIAVALSAPPQAPRVRGCPPQAPPVRVEYAPVVEVAPVQPVAYSLRQAFGAPQQTCTGPNCPQSQPARTGLFRRWR